MHSRLVQGVLLALFVISPLAVFGQETSDTETESSPAVDLAVKQGQLADKYKRLEAMMLKMAEYDASSNPRRSALLKQALAKGKDRHITLQMETLVKLFQQEQLQRAIDNQADLRTDLQVLLDLLLSENRPDRLQNEQSRLRRYIKELDRIIRIQKAVQGRTEGGADAKKLAQDQEQVARRTQQLGKEIDETEKTDAPQSSEDAGAGSPRQDGPGKEQPSSPSEGELGAPESGKTYAVETADGKVIEGKIVERNEDGIVVETKDGERVALKDEEIQEIKASQEGQQGEGQQGEGQQGQGQQGEGQQGQDGQAQQSQQQDSFPGRERIEAAEEKMREAQRRLEEARRKDAVEEQEEARRLLELAKAELEEILRQLREEEIERVLAMLEGRFRKMLEMQLKVYDNTLRLNKIPAARRSRQFSIQTAKLSLEERKIVLEVDKALTLLREEGSSVAFPEAVSQMRGDMDTVVRRLSEEKVGRITQGLEEDIVAALEELIEALQKAQKEAEERRNQQQPPPGSSGDPTDQPLVDAVAELKMIRALQVRVNKRTKRYAQLLDDLDDPVGQAEDEDLVDSLRQLSDRQQRIHRVTSDIVLGKNK